MKNVAPRALATADRTLSPLPSPPALGIRCFAVHRAELFNAPFSLLDESPQCICREWYLLFPCQRAKARKHHILRRGEPTGLHQRADDPLSGNRQMKLHDNPFHGPLVGCSFIVPIDLTTLTRVVFP